MATEDDDPAMPKSEAIDDEQKVYRSGAKPRADAMATEDDRVNAVDKAPEVEPPKVDSAAEPQREEPERQGRVYKNIVSRYVCLDYLHIYSIFFVVVVKTTVFILFFLFLHNNKLEEFHFLANLLCTNHEIIMM